MKLELIRYKSNSDATLGKLLVDGQFVCYTLEDEYRSVKVKHETRIPAGTYEIKLRTYGGFHERYKKKFPEIHMGTLELMKVPGFTDILIHTGNTEEDTSGCILVGLIVDEKNFTIRAGTSTLAYIKLYTKVREAFLRKESVTITIKDNDR